MDNIQQPDDRRRFRDHDEWSLHALHHLIDLAAGIGESDPETLRELHRLIDSLNGKDSHDDDHHGHPHRAVRIDVVPGTPIDKP